MKRDWTEAREKVDTEGCCRVCGPRVVMSKDATRVEAAHVIGRARDTGGKVDAMSVVPLCGPATSSSTCHGRYDAHRLDLLPYLTPAEQARAVADAGGIESARRRISGRHPAAA